MADKTGITAEQFNIAVSADAKIAVAIDADLVDAMKRGGGDWSARINDLIRFFVDTDEARELQAQPDAFEAGEMQDDDTGMTAEWATEQREALRLESEDLPFDPQQQPDGTYRDVEAERRSRAPKWTL